MGHLPDRYPIRIGILLGRDLSVIDVPALSYLILHLNRLQSTFEYEILPTPSDDPLFHELDAKRIVDRQKVKSMLPGFAERYKTNIEEQKEGFNLTEEVCSHIMVLTLARFDDGYYSFTIENIGIIALGNWKRVMAPPSLFEFTLTLLLEESVLFLNPTLKNIFHYGTKGCLFDFNPYLVDIRYKTLQGYVCSHCRRTLSDAGFPNLAEEIVRIQSKDWLGKSTDPNSPACIVSNLGVNLFITKGLKQTTWETFTTTLQQESIKEFIKLIGAVILAAILIYLGLKE